MPTRDEVLATVKVLADEVAAARQSIRSGTIPTLLNVQQRFEACGRDVAELDPDDAISVRPALQALLDDLQTLSDTIAEIQARLQALEQQDLPAKTGS